MIHKTFVPATLALALLLSAPVLGHAAHEHGAPAADAAAGAKAAPAVDPDKAYLLKQEYVAKTAELHGKLKAREAELETVLATKPGDEAAIKKLAAEISTLRGQLFEQTTQYRLRYAKETGTPIRQTRHLGGKGGMMDGMMGDDGMECKMMGKGMGMMMGKDGMDHGGKPGMDHANMPGMGQMGQGNMPGMGHGNMPGMAAPAAPATKDAPAAKQ